jgi:hypothetical protein
MTPQWTALKEILGASDTKQLQEVTNMAGTAQDQKPQPVDIVVQNEDTGGKPSS